MITKVALLGALNNVATVVGGAISVKNAVTAATPNLAALPNTLKKLADMASGIQFKKSAVITKPSPVQAEIEAGPDLEKKDGNYGTDYIKTRLYE